MKSEFLAIMLLVFACVPMQSPAHGETNSGIDAEADITLWVKGCRSGVAYSIRLLYSGDFSEAAEYLYAQAEAEGKCSKIALTARNDPEMWKRFMTTLKNRAKNGLVAIPVEDGGLVYLFWPLIRAEGSQLR